MMRVALKGLATRKLRAAFTASAVVLGVALISGTFVLTDSIEKAFQAILSRSYERTDAVVTGPDLHGTGSAPVGVPGTGAIVDRELLERIRALPEVAAAAGTLVDFSRGADPATIIGPQGRPIERRGPTYAFGIEPGAERFNPLELVTGRWAAGPGEVVLDAETAERHRYGTGDAVGIMTLGPVERFTVVGTARFRDVETMGGAAVALFDLETAQRLHRKDGFYTIAVAAQEGVSGPALLRAIRPLLPVGAGVRSGGAQAAQDAEAASFVRSIRQLLLAFGVVTLAVGAFVIVNTMSITVAQRTRELGTLRAVGASRRQLRRSVVLEGAVLGAAASIAGLAGGLLLADGLSAALRALELELPESDPVFRWRTAVVSLAAGIGVTTLAALVPAVRATRVPPLAAIRASQATADGAPSRRRSRAAAGLLALGGIILLSGIVLDGPSTGGRMPLAVLGSVALLAGTMLSAPSLTGPVVGWMSGLFALRGGAATALARANAVRNPTRTAATAAALLVGLGLSTFAAVLHHAVVASGETSIRAQTRADHLVESPGWRRSDADLGRRIASAPGVSGATSIRSVRGGAVLEGAGMVGVSGVDPVSVTGLYRMDWEQGSDATLRRLGPDGAVLDAEAARSARLAIGDPVVLSARDGRRIELTLRGTFRAAGRDSLLGQVVIADTLFARSFPSVAPAVTLVRVRDADALRRVLRQVPDATARTPGEFAAERNRELTSVLRLLAVLLVLCVLVGVLGMINTLVLSVFERTREIGVLRALGMTRREVRRMVRHEGILTALLGAALGVPLGVVTAAAVLEALDAEGLHVSVPLLELVLLLAGTAIAGVAAAVLPARRASRLDPVMALQEE